MMTEEEIKHADMGLLADNATPQELARYDGEAAWERFLETHPEALASAATPRWGARLWHLWRNVAAVALPLVLAVSWAVVRWNAHDSLPTTMATEVGKAAKLTLPDSTQVELQGGSVLTYDARLMQRGQREVELDGQAYFRVRRQGDRAPFTIHTSTADVRVTGTTFTLSSRTDNNYVRLRLDEGRVEFIPHSTGITQAVTPGQELIYDKTSGRINLRHQPDKASGQHSPRELKADVQALFSGGDGTRENPYIISNAQHMCHMRQALRQSRLTCFALDSDIDLQGIDWQPLNTSESKFLYWISLDGRNHSILHLSAREGPFEGAEYASFFGVLCGECRNVAFVGADIASIGMGAGVLGGYVGHPTYPHTTIVENCYADGQVTAYSYAGGLAGNIGGSTRLEDCYCNVSVVSMKSYAGGLSGKVRAQLDIRNCWVAGSVFGIYAGGIVGGDQDAHTPAGRYRDVLVSSGSITGTHQATGLGTLRPIDHQSNLLVSPATHINGRSLQQPQDEVSLRRITDRFRQSWYSRQMLNP